MFAIKVDNFTITEFFDWMLENVGELGTDWKILPGFDKSKEVYILITDKEKSTFAALRWKK
jgi:hypothetical protein